MLERPSSVTHEQMVDDNNSVDDHPEDVRYENMTLYVECEI